MTLLRKQKPIPPSPAQTVQTGRTAAHPFSAISAYQPLYSGDMKIFEAIREAVPIIDAAIGKTVRLAGGFHVVCGSKAAEQRLNRFLTTVPVGASCQGITAFVSAYLDQLLMYGTAVGEIVPAADGTGIYALYNAPLSDISLCTDETGLTAQVCQGSLSDCTPVERPELILLSALAPKPGEVSGTSILKGLPFLVDILLKIYNTIGVNFERVGNLRFAVTYKPGEDGMDKAFAKERAGVIAEQWRKAMQPDGTVSDFVAVGDVDIKVIGADNQILDTSVPVRQILEQLVAKLGIPPFMLGLSWSTTERMSAQQADILTSELEYYREIITPVLLKICNLWLCLNGCQPDAFINWSVINLQDETELARARLMNAQAKQIEEKLNPEENND